MSNLSSEELKFTPIKDEDFVSNTFITLFCILAVISIIIWFIWCSQNDFEVISSIGKAILLIIITFAGSSMPTQSETNELQRKKDCLKEKNKQYVLKITDEILYQNGFTNISKEIVILLKAPEESPDLTPLIEDEKTSMEDIRKFAKQFETYYIKKLVIEEEKNLIGYIDYKIIETTGEESSHISTAKYNEILSYDIIDKTTSTQIATSKTSSNSGKAIGGAIVSNLLFGNATVGAVVGGSGARTTETITKTNKEELYQINIYVNNLHNSIIKIETSDRNVISEIVAVLEIIMNKTNNMEE